MTTFGVLKFNLETFLALVVHPDASGLVQVRNYKSLQKYLFFTLISAITELKE